MTLKKHKTHTILPSVLILSRGGTARFPGCNGICSQKFTDRSGSVVRLGNLSPVSSEEADSLEDVFGGQIQALKKAASILVERVGLPQHPEPLPRSRRHTMPEGQADPAVSMRKKDPWEAGAISTPTPHNNWRRG